MSGELVLGIESSCDETAAAVVRDGDQILSNVIHSQIDLRRMQGRSAICYACDAKRAFPTMDWMIALFSYQCIGMAQWWLQARALLWGMTSWDFLTGDFEIDQARQPRMLLIWIS